MVDGAIARADLAIGKLSGLSEQDAQEVESAIKLLKTVAAIFRRECEERVAEDARRVSEFIEKKRQGGKWRIW